MTFEEMKTIDGELQRLEESARHALHRAWLQGAKAGPGVDEQTEMFGTAEPHA